MTTQLDVDRKFCTKCGLLKPRLEFSSRMQRTNIKLYRAFNAYCKPCASVIAKEKCDKDLAKANEAQKRSRLKRHYGMTLEEFDKKLESQGGGCAICGTKTPGGMGRFPVDHCHRTGVIRGLLCTNCNRGIGALKDDPDLLRRAIDYLESYK